MRLKPCSARLLNSSSVIASSLARRVSTSGTGRSGGRSESDLGQGPAAMAAEGPDARGVGAGSDQRRGERPAATPGPGSPVGRPGGGGERRRDHRKSVAAEDARPAPACPVRRARRELLTRRAAAMASKHVPAATRIAAAHARPLALRSPANPRRRRRRRGRPCRRRSVSAPSSPRGLRTSATSRSRRSARAHRTGRTSSSSRSPRSQAVERHSFALQAAGADDATVR